MEVDATVRGVALADIGAWARRCEDAGFAALYTTETNNDPFLPLALAASQTRRLGIGTGIALAFPRSPMEVAYTAWDLQALSGGRFVLGLGSQVRAHVERRFGATWSRPAARMREYVLALRAIWAAWRDGTPLEFRGELYSHTLMPPGFRPRALASPPPPVVLAGVRDRMMQVAGEVADGLLVHPLQTPRWVREVALPALERGLESGGRERGDVTLSVALLTAVTPEETEAVRRRIAFYGSTPAYRGVLALHDREDLFAELHELSRSGGWERMSALVDDELLDAIAVRGPTAEAVAAEIARRYEGLADRINLHAGAVSGLGDAVRRLATLVPHRGPSP